MMNRRSFAQFLGGPALLSSLAKSSGAAPAPGTPAPGKIMAITAHPGDGLFTMGAALANQVERGGSAVLVSLSLGEKGAPNNIPVHEYGEMQRTATEKATSLIGAKNVFILYPDAEIPFNDESSMRVADAIREHKPEIVITHWNGSWHKDHQNCHLIAHDAIFYAGLDSLPRKYPAHTVSKVFFADNWEDATNFVPDSYVNIEPVYQKWLQACDFYPMWRGQTGFFRYNDYYSSLAVMRGCIAGCKTAVALMSEPSQRAQHLQHL
jgi:LmbE family N-acetylglucosaminyl deacetylase